MGRYCSGCHQYQPVGNGHNIRTCPVVTKRHQQRLEKGLEALERAKEVGEDTTWSERTVRYHADILKERTGKDPITGEKVAKRASTPRRCSYCKYKFGEYADEGLGHTRRTCTFLKEDLAAAARANGVYRKKFLEVFDELGIGPGAILRARISCIVGDEWKRVKRPFLVTGVDWEHVNWVNYSTANIILCKPLAPSGRQTHWAFPPPRMPTRWDGKRRRWLDAHVGTDPVQTHKGLRVGTWGPYLPENDLYKNERMSLIGGSASRFSPPSGWLDGDSKILRDHFKALKA